jgi:hypothetical protein
VVLLLLGAGLVAWSHRVLATFFLDVVVLSLQPGGLEPYDFSWGTMTWGRSAVDFTLLCAGFVALALGQWLVLPGLVGRLKRAKAIAVAAGVLMLVGAIAFAFIPINVKSIFSTLTVAGAVDPLSFAEELPVMACRVFAGCWVVAHVLLAMAALVAVRGEATAGRMNGLAVAAGGSGAMVALLLVAIHIGPVRVFTGIVTAQGQMDPAELAGQLSLAIHLLFAAWPVLLAGAVLMILTALRSD